MSSTYIIEDCGIEAKKRYNEKLKTINQSCCPYLMPADVWNNDPTKWPALEYPEVYTYLIESPGVYTKEAMKSRKSLEAHNQFSSGWVRTVLHYMIPNTNFVIMKADVTPSQRINDHPHTPWIAINATTTNVINAHCTCMAGLGESCSHIGALLFKIEAAVRIIYTRKTCTEEACQWNNDFREKVECAELSQIKFYQSSSVENFKKSTYTEWPFPGTGRQPTNSEKDTFLTSLSRQTTRPVVLHTYSGHFHDFIPKFVPPERAKLPKMLRELYSIGNQSKSLEEIRKMSRELVSTMTILKPTVDYVLDLTKNQSQSQIWHDVRAGRITASIAHDILHTNILKPSESLIKRVCQQSKVVKTTIPALKWGIDNESNALDDYQMTHQRSEIKRTGIKLHYKYPFIGASPDGIFSCSCHNSDRLLEVKCPFSKKDTYSIEEAIDDNFFLDRTLVLKSTHKYYTQIQIQMWVFDFQECDFLVWTPNWMYSQTVHPNEKFIHCSLPVFESFFENHVVPELLTRKLENYPKLSVGASSSRKREELYCICNCPYSDMMKIGLDVMQRSVNGNGSIRPTKKKSSFPSYRVEKKNLTREAAKKIFLQKIIEE